MVTRKCTAKGQPTKEMLLHVLVNARAGSLGLGKPHSAVQSHIHGNNMQCILTFNKNVRQKHPYKELQPSQHQES